MPEDPDIPKTPADDDVLYLDADDTSSEEDMDAILQEAQDAADRMSERQEARAAARAAEAREQAAESAGAAVAVSAEPPAGTKTPPARRLFRRDKQEYKQKALDLQRKVGSLEEELTHVRANLRELKEALQRKQADYENFRKRMQRDKEEFQKYAHGSLLKELLPVLDNMERATMVHGKADPESIRQGVELVLKQFTDTLERFGLKSVEALGKEFDPNFHEAVTSEETGDHPHNAVIDELQRGYMHHDRLLRAAMVKVAVNPADQQKQENGDAALEASDDESTDEAKAVPGIESPKVSDGQRPSVQGAMLEDEGSESDSSSPAEDADADSKPDAKATASGTADESPDGVA